MTAPRPSAVLFDAVGTLLVPNPPVGEAYAHHGRRYGSRLSEAEVTRRFRRAFKREDERDRTRFGWRTDERRERRRWCSIVRAVFDDAWLGDALFARLWRHFAEPDNWRLAPGAVEAIELVRSHGLPWALASNFDTRLLRIVRAMPELASAKQVFVSSAVGWRKPSPKFFATIERELALEPHRLLLVGDDLVNDFQAAQAAGWQAMLVDPGKRLAGLAGLLSPASS
jgi:putative hydrolase of the HAD superfamily